MQETKEMQVQSLGWEDPLQEGATSSSTLGWRIPMDRGAWWAGVHGVTKSQTRLHDWRHIVLLLGVFCSWGCRRTVLELRWSSPPQEPEVSFSSAFLILLLLLSSLSSEVQLWQHIICSHNHFTRQRDCCSSFTVSVLRRKTISRRPSAQGRVSRMSPWPDLCHLSVLHWSLGKGNGLTCLD